MTADRRKRMMRRIHTLQTSGEERLSPGPSRDNIRWEVESVGSISGHWETTPELMDIGHYDSPPPSSPPPQNKQLLFVPDMHELHLDALEMPPHKQV